MTTVNKSGASPDKWLKYEEAFKFEAMYLASERYLASESRSTEAAARQLCISPKLLYLW